MGVTTCALFNLGSSDKMQVYLESAIIMDYFDFLQKMELIVINEAFLSENGALYVYFE